MRRLRTMLRIAGRTMKAEMQQQGLHPSRRLLRKLLRMKRETDRLEIVVNGKRNFPWDTTSS